MSRPRRIFNAVGKWAILPFFAIQTVMLSLVPTLGDEKAEVKQRLEVSDADIKTLAGSRVAVMRPEKASSVLYAGTLLAPEEVRARLEYRRENPDPLFGYRANKSPFWGRRGMVDTLSVGLSGHIFPSVVYVPEKAIDPVGMIHGYTGIPAEQIVGMKDKGLAFEKLIFFHELAHCNQSILTERDIRELEYGAEREAMRYYLAQGGDPDIVRAKIYMQAIETLNNAFFTPTYFETDYDYGYGLSLYHEFELKQKPASLAAGKNAFRHAAYLINTHKPGRSTAPRNTREYMLDTAESLLERQGALLAPEVRQVLELYRDGHLFFTGYKKPYTIPLPSPTPL